MFVMTAARIVHCPCGSTIPLTTRKTAAMIIDDDNNNNGGSGMSLVKYEEISPTTAIMQFQNLGSEAMCQQ